MSMEIQQAKKDYNVLQSDMDKVIWKFNYEYCFMNVINNTFLLSIFSFFGFYYFIHMLAIN